MNMNVYNYKIRLDSFALICDYPKTTETLSVIEFDLIKKFLYYNSDNASPSCRQCIISSLKKVFK